MHRKTGNRIYGDDEQFELGKAKVLKDGDDLAIFATGCVLVPEALEAAKILSKDGISAAVIDLHTIKPLDGEMILKYAKKTGAVLTCENHQADSGIGCAVAAFLSAEYPTLVHKLGIREEFGEVAELAWLKERFGLNANNICTYAKELLKKKKE